MEDKVLCVSMYLKSSIVSSNDNSIPLTGTQEKLVRVHEDIVNSLKK